MGLVGRDVRRRRPTPGAAAVGRLTCSASTEWALPPKKITPENTISHTGTERIKQPLTLLDGCQRAGVYFEHIFERR